MHSRFFFSWSLYLVSFSFSLVLVLRPFNQFSDSRPRHDGYELKSNLITAPSIIQSHAMTGLIHESVGLSMCPLLWQLLQSGSLRTPFPTCPTFECEWSIAGS